MIPTAEQLHILQHSLGLDQYGQGRDYRNHYVAGPETDCWPDLQILVNAGWMEDHGAQQKLCGGAHYLSVTREGRKAIRTHSPKPPKLTKGRRVYLAYLNLDFGISFGEFLKDPYFAELRRNA